MVGELGGGSILYSSLEDAGHSSVLYICKYFVVTVKGLSTDAILCGKLYRTDVLPGAPVCQPRR